MNTALVSVLGTIATIVLTVLVYVLVMPKSRYNQMGGFGKFLHNFFNFKKLYLEAVIRFFYVLSTVACVGFGFFFLFGKTQSWLYGEQWTFGYGLGLIILGPILTRICYEWLMLLLLLVKNVIEINNRLSDNNGENSLFANESSFTEKFSNVAVNAAAGAAASVQQSIQEQQNVQAPVENAPVCSNCGAPLSENDKFCVNCGKPKNQ